MQPSTLREKEIARKVDQKARAIADGDGKWGDNIIREMRVAVGFVCTEAECEFLEKYVAWRRGNSLRQEV
jgi:hypothetical protein